LSRFNNLKQRIICLDADRAGNVYFGTYEGVFQVSKTMPQAKMVWNNKDQNNLVRFITATSPDSIFFNQYNGQSTSIVHGVLKNYTAKDNVGQSFFKQNSHVYRLTTSTVEHFRNGTFGRFITFGPLTNFAFDALCDVEGNVWIGTWEGLFKYRYNPFTIYQRKETQHSETFSLLETAGGELFKV
jgi:ligand-binding sensor domain-containing protein